MEQPKKITPERLKDTIVELRYNTAISFEYIPGLVHEAVKGVLSPVDIGRHQFSLDPAKSVFIGTRKGFLQNDIIRLQIEEGGLIFNSNGEYKGWSAFMGAIKTVMELIAQKDWLQGIHWVGLRYVSEFAEIQIFDKLIWDFQYQWGQASSLNTTFRTEWADEEDRIIVRLLNNGQREGDVYSLIDIDVNHNFGETKAVAAAFDTIERLHTKEKDVFFGLMRPEFLTSLNPTY